MERHSYTLPSWADTESGRSPAHGLGEEVRTFIRDALVQYLARASALEVVDRILIGVNWKEREAMIFNILVHDVSASETGTRRYADLVDFGGDLEILFSRFFVTSVLYVNQSDLSQVLRDHDRLGLKTECVRLRPG